MRGDTTACKNPTCLPWGESVDEQYPPTIYRFEKHTCVVTDPSLAGLKQISFTSPDFFANCPQIEIDYIDPNTNFTNINFNGLKLNPNMGLDGADYIFQGSSTEELYTFGQTVEAGVENQIARSIPSFKRPDGTIFFSDEMQLSVRKLH